MSTVLLIHQKKIQHYRVPVYNYLAQYLQDHRFILKIASNGVEDRNPHQVTFNHIEIPLNFVSLVRTIRKITPDAIIFFVNLRNLYLFPILLLSIYLKIKIIYWGQAKNLENDNIIMNIAYRFKHYLANSIILYADFLKKYVNPKYHSKVFVANNTIDTTVYDHVEFDKEKTLARYAIKTKKNIICMGRMQKRKRIRDLILAFRSLKLRDVGLVLAGPDTEGILKEVGGKNIYKVGPLYGEDAIQLLGSCDLCCLPGHVGLSIVDAFYCGLPLVTENVDHAPEISYLKHGINGFIVPKGDIRGLAEKLELLLTNDALRRSFAKAAKTEVQTNARIDIMCEGFRKSLDFVFKPKNL